MPAKGLHMEGRQSVKSLSLSVLPRRFAVCQLALDADLSFLSGLASHDLWSVTRTKEELSVVLPEAAALLAWRAERGWRCLKVRGPLDFSLTGVLASLVTPLAEAGISVFALSTYDTDYLLVRDADLKQTVAVLSAHRHTIQRGPDDSERSDPRLHPDSLLDTQKEDRRQ